MFVAITGTPGTGKTSVSNILKQKNYTVLGLNEIAISNNFILGIDEKRDSKILDIEKLNNFISKSYDNSDLIFIEGHASHLLDIVDKVIVLRCHPKKLQKRLEKKGWGKDKILENVEAEALDIILCEVVEYFLEEQIFEIDTSDKKPIDVERDVENIIKGKTKNYTFGKIDWSEEIV